MNGYVVVRLLTGPLAPDARTSPPWDTGLPDPAPVLRPRMGPTADGRDLVAEAGPLRQGSAASRQVPGTTADEHFTAEAERGGGRRRLDCADVLYGRLPRLPGAAARWLAEVTARHPACGLAAVPVRSPSSSGPSPSRRSRGTPGTAPGGTTTWP